jgi:formate dehydrogenase subunit delta
MSGAGSQPPGGPVIQFEVLVAMANQIGDFFAPYPPGQREEGVRNHLRHYWDPRMRQALLDHIERTGGSGLHPHVLSAARQLTAPTGPRGAYAGPPRS